MEHTTGPPTAKFADLLIRLREEGVEVHPPSMGLRNALKAMLIHMRHNITQAVIGEQPGARRHDLAGYRGYDRRDRPDPERHAAHREGDARGLRLLFGRCPLSLLEPAESPCIVLAVSTIRLA